MAKVVDLSDKNNVGNFADYTALIAKLPVGKYGQYAYLYSTSTTWCWDLVGLAWVDSGT